MEKIRYYDELLRFVACSVHDMHEAQDLVQQTFEKLLQNYGHIPLEKQRPLLYEVARNLLIDRYRQQQRYQHVGDEMLAGMPAAEACQPEVIVAQRQRMQRLLAALQSLPPRCRQAFVLHRMEGHPQAEVARLMGISINMVERHIMLAVATCRKVMMQDEPGHANRQPASAPVPDSKPSVLP